MSDTMVKRDLKIEDILLERDFHRLNSNTLRIIGVLMEKGYEGTDDLYKDKDNIYINESAYAILKSKIFACKTSIKYWGLSRIDKLENRNALIETIESWDFYNNNKINELEPKVKNKSLETPTAYTCLKIEDEIYLMRFIVPCGNKRDDDGISDTKIRQYKNVVCFINIKYGYIEIRTESTYAERVIEVLQYKLNLNGVRTLPILGHFNNNIEDFKDSFENAKFINSKSIPEFDFDISEEDSEMLVEVLLILEDFITNNKDETFLDELKNINFNDNSNGFIPLLLAGLCGIGFSTRKTDIRDITNQPMYKIIEPYLTHQIGMLHVTDDDTGQTYSLQISLKNNSIAFKSALTDERFIKIVRNKLLNIEEE
ncbi:hypothetical protein PN294_14530 [Romboutsia sp. 1001216sp1]|uniref:hypothetical protein n=1 Tax=unclassified Romboutsia TaxID=2626894 RepID=UPI00189F9474|nr:MULTISPECIES: hypothetical protein [unclassified Romboutsia]MDB8803396.1 hypothetical protein [Romboutsia sp. 1001216sp1]MDB8814793.1 hypothetical protein [Romboutsia sp. 1001216sp1]